VSLWSPGATWRPCPTGSGRASGAAPHTRPRRSSGRTDEAVVRGVGGGVSRRSRCTGKGRRTGSRSRSPNRSRRRRSGGAGPAGGRRRAGAGGGQAVARRIPAWENLLWLASRQVNRREVPRINGALGHEPRVRPPPAPTRPPRPGHSARATPPGRAAWAAPPGSLRPDEPCPPCPDEPRRSHFRCRLSCLAAASGQPSKPRTGSGPPPGLCPVYPSPRPGLVPDALAGQSRVPRPRQGSASPSPSRIAPPVTPSRRPLTPAPPGPGSSRPRARP
jgi:hypothetical protein